MYLVEYVAQRAQERCESEDGDVRDKIKWSNYMWMGGIAALI